MAFNYTQGLTPTEIAFICEMELITVVPRQRLERLELVGGTVNALVPPQRANIPLWLAVLLKRQMRIDIVPPPWLHPDSLNEILELETDHFPDSFSPAPLPSQNSSSGSLGQNVYHSPPFLKSSTASASAEALPYHWLEVGQILLDGAPEDLVEPDKVRQLMRDLREVRAAKMRKGIEVLTGDGQGVRLDGVGAMEIGQNRSFIIGVVDGLRKLGASREQAQKERAVAEGDNDDGVEDDMEF